MRPAAVAAMLVVLAGCITTDDGPDGAGEGAGAIPIDLAALYEFEHDHADPVAHNITWGFEQVGYHALTEDGVPSGIVGEIDVATEGTLAVVHLEGARSGFAVVDISEITRPRLLSFADAEAFRPFEGRDVKIDATGGYAYLALQLAGPAAPASPTASGGFLVYSLADPAAPELVAQGIEPGRGCHMIRYWELGDDRVVYCASTQGLTIFRLVDGPAGPRTPVKAGDYVPADVLTTLERAQGGVDPADPAGSAVGAATLVQPHDMTAQQDPLTGDPVLVAAHETYGIRVLDIADPALPRELSVWAGDGAAHYGRVHTALLAGIDGRRIAIGVTETLGDVTPAFYLVDMTDYASPRFVAEWTPPENATSRGILFSTHNHQLVGTTMYMAHFHAGVWAFDISDPAHPRPTGVFAVRQPRIDAHAVEAPSYWDVVVRDGYVLASDMTAGLVVLARDGDPVGDAAWDSFV